MNIERIVKCEMQAGFGVATPISMTGDNKTKKDSYICDNVVY